MTTRLRGRPLACLVAAILTLTELSACKRALSEPSAYEPPVSSPPPAQARAFYATKYARKPPVAELTALGRALFQDPVLSANGQLACASCHDPAHAYGPPDGRTVQTAGTIGGPTATRAIPSLRYRQIVPRFSLHTFDSEGDGSDQGPTGGFTWDGRAQSAHDQAGLPLFSPLEMANASPVELVGRVRDAVIGGKLRAAFGDDLFDVIGADGGKALNAVLLAIETFEESPIDFYPYDSKYDAVLRNQAKLDPAEARGLAVFDDAKKGNCASCHGSHIKEGGLPAFTDFGHIALAVPRRKDAETGRYDLGLCGPLRTDLADDRELCGLFRAPPLRNVALRKVFMHNGVFTKLDDAVRFYAERDVRPEKWYPRKADGTVDIYDDLPPQYWEHINRDPPFDRKPGDPPALTEPDIADLVAFLGTLTDGYRP